MRMTLGDTLLLYPTFVEGIRRASNRGYILTSGKVPVTPNNTLRYILSEPTKQLTIELIEKPCIGNCRYYFRPAKKMILKSIEECHDRYIEVKAFQTIIDNSIIICFYKLLLYGGTGQNWQKMMQYSLVTQCLRKLIHEQAYVIESRYMLEFFYFTTSQCFAY
ncbi:hypothetical protein SAMN05444349_12665 [Bacteroides faecichinchillae]|uniref:Urocanase N-terminal domain-containing protein n=1 Tax=Bacteroides faecichinchillae TaxID=871325 RepID=A0A1M5D142_9BACE|nr:hypothetical protein [Bacteroides faecichinchillae]THG59150.1 hypothetical protein E5981_15570 [Bacteroides faecichinchillae]SHF60634.1 hypothetical protein SAMN05444349_12665 [Bacteroides faecichinchillae]